MQLFKEFDKDGDGTISVEEFMAGLKVCLPYLKRSTWTTTAQD